MPRRAITASSVSPHKAPSLRLLAPILVAIAALLLTLNYQSISLDDFDSGSFALALDHFDIALQQPQPPGFPVYVALGRAARLITGDARSALTLISAVTGAIAVGALAWFGAEIGSASAGTLAALWLLALPGWWLTSEMALSDVPGVTLTLVSVTWLWKGRDDLRWFAAGAALSGLSLGLRPQNAIPIALFGGYALALTIRRRVAWTRIALVTGIGLVAVLVWLVPTLISTGGLDPYLALLRDHSAHVTQIDSLFAQPVSIDSLALRAAAFGNGLIGLVGGDSRLALLTLAVLIVGLVRVPWRIRDSSPPNPRPLSPTQAEGQGRSGVAKLSISGQQEHVRSAAWLLAAWALAEIAQVFLLESLERPRLYLTFVPPLALLAALGWTRILRPKIGYAHKVLAIPLLLCAALLFTSLPLVATLTREAAPPFQATAFIAATYPAAESLVVTQGSLRAAQIGLPAYPQLYLGEFDAAAWTQSVATRKPRYLILMDRDDVWPEAYAALTDAGQYVPVLDRVFSRDPRVFPQHSLIRVEVLSPLDQVPPESLALPPGGIIQVGDTANSKYFGEGWYRAEDIGGVSARWTQQDAVMRVALPPSDTTLTLEATPYGGDQSVEVEVNGQSIGTLPLRGIWQSVSVHIPTHVLAGYQVSTITLHHARADMPPGSNRALSAAYRTITFGGFFGTTISR